MNTIREYTMTYDGRWHAQGLRWVASLLESAAAYLESNVHEVADDVVAPNSVEEVRLRAHLRGFQ